VYCKRDPGENDLFFELLFNNYQTATPAYYLKKEGGTKKKLKFKVVLNPTKNCVLSCLSNADNIYI